eukprot:4867563-Lingulodinium_polyedra.AAC.1
MSIQTPDGGQQISARPTFGNARVGMYCAYIRRRHMKREDRPARKSGRQIRRLWAKDPPA